MASRTRRHPSALGAFAGLMILGLCLNALLALVLGNWTEAAINAVVAVVLWWLNRT